MTVTQHDTNENAVGDGYASPGKRLREARLARHLDIEDVADALRLDLDIVEALERDDYASLPAPTFVRGYLRGYSRLLDLPPTPIIEAFDRYGLAPPNLVADISNRSEARSTDPAVRLATIGVVSAIVILAALWWHNQGDNGATPEEPASLAGEELAADIAPPLEDDDVGIGDDANQDRASTTIAPAPPAAIDSQADTATAAIDAGRAPLPSGAEAQASQEPVEAEPTPVAEAPPPPPEPDTIIAPDQGRLALRFQRDSWVEIYDVDSKRLYFNLAKGGDTVEVAGRIPIRVLLGYAQGVEIQYNGQPFDQGPYTDKGVARFTLGGSAEQP